MVFYAVENLSIKRDPRIPQVKKILQAIIGKADLKNATKVLVTRDNFLVAVLFDSAIYATTLKDVEPGLVNISFNGCDAHPDSELDDDCFIEIPGMTQTLTNLFDYYRSRENDQFLLARDNQLRGNEKFEKLMELKAADGAKFYQLYSTISNQSYSIPIFSGFPTLNKSDQIGISVYDLLDGHFLNIMNIFKKKINRDVKIYYRTINFGRSLD